MYIFHLFNSKGWSNYVYMVCVLIFALLLLTFLVIMTVMEIKYTTREDIEKKIISVKYRMAKLVLHDDVKIILNFETPVALMALENGFFLDEDLVEIVEGSQSDEVRLLAVDWIHNIRVLEDLKERISDKDILKLINKNISTIRNERRFNYIKNCLMEVRDNDSEEFLKDMALNNTSCTVRNKAISKIKNNATLFDILRKARLEDIKIAAVKCITDVKILREIALGYYADSIRVIAIRNMTSDFLSLFEHISLSDEYNYDSRSIAISKLSDSDFLLGHIAINEEDVKLALQAVGKIRRQKVLLAVALKSRHAIIRVAAAEGVTDTELISQLVPEFVKFKEIYSLKNKELLRQILCYNEDYKHIKEYCAEQLNLKGNELCEIIGHDFEYELSMDSGTPIFSQRHCLRCDLIETFTTGMEVI